MSKGSIVSVDDDKDFQLYLSHLLRDRGYSVEALTDGDQLLSRLSSGAAPCLILMDVMMPGNDGIQIIEKIRSAPSPKVKASGGVPMQISSDVIWRIDFGKQSHAARISR